MLRLQVNLVPYGPRLEDAHKSSAANQLINAKFIPDGIEIKTESHQRISYRFWRGLLEHRLCRLKRLKQLRLSGLSDDSACELAKVLHDLSINPGTVIFDGVAVE